MGTTMRATGLLMLAYAGIYAAHFVFDTLYAAGPVWAVLNVVSGVGIVVALAANLAHLRGHAGSSPDAVTRIGAHALLYANAALAIWFFRNWVHLLALAEGESTSVHSDVLWMIIAALIPLVLAATGWRLWRA